ncbi:MULTISPECIES: patatin-like phospholipase family protein [Aneurinibacillus]|uniref:Phospholipase n=1 Tax=Aneurinibacillus danicus TaxID=267746 RepID=A0A511V1R6_9BACL|nr:MULTISPECIES: patatin-like phospholipase family protein [Aneurinibacillus]GEN32840.1 phospholipase [Aneurinibacillus danicus]
MKKIDAVFEGGGVKGIAFVGAITEFERRGFGWNRVAGTSAGAIIASLVAAGYRADELNELMKGFDYMALQKKQGLARIPGIGSWLNLWVKKGFYSGDYLYNWMNIHLAAKNVHVFGDLPSGTLKVIASNITDGRLLVLPDDAEQLGLCPRSLSVALAVRMSASLPFYFEPIIIRRQGLPVYVVDGGILSRFPLWLFEENSQSCYSTIGFRLSASYETKSYRINTLPEYMNAMLKTMMQAHDQRYIEKQHAARTVFIPTEGIPAAKFDITEEERKWLYQSGEAAAKQFMIRLPSLRIKRKTS